MWATSWARSLLMTLHICAALAIYNSEQLRTLENSMDRSVDPCVDYYQYACGNWGTMNDADKYAETVGLVDYKANYVFTHILNSIKRSTPYRQHRFVRNVRNYYRACKSLVDYEPVRYLKWLSKREHLNWPTPLPHSARARATASSSAGKDAVIYDWLRMLATLRKYGLNGIFVEETVVQHAADVRRSTVDIDKPVLAGGFKRMKYEELLLILEYLDAADRRSVSKLWDDFEMFEVQLESLNDVEDDEATEQQVKLSALKLPWLERYLSIVLETSVDTQMEINIQNLPYMKTLIELLGTYEPEFICRYLMLRFLWHLNLDGPTHFYNRDCAAHTRNMLPLAMNWLYEYYNPALLRQTPKVEALFRKLLHHFNGTLNANANNFDASVLKFLHSKVAAMQIKVGNLPRPATAAALEQFYRNLSVHPSDFYGNHLQALAFLTRTRHARLHSLLPAAVSDFFHLEDHETGGSSSPYYLLRSNVVIVPLTLLHMPIYHPQLHDIFKYSSLGFLLAHEITHGFDDSGVEVDLHGNTRGPSDVIKSNVVFDAKLSCLRSKNPHIIDEKIADVSGLRWAYESYFGNGSASTRPLTWSKYKPERLFFLNFAQFFCGTNEGPDDSFSEHGPDHERVFHTLSNFEEFARIYDCPLGSPMHPEEKCQLWR